MMAVLLIKEPTPSFVPTSRGGKPPFYPSITSGKIKRLKKKNENIYFPKNIEFLTNALLCANYIRYIL